ncbi:TM1812 family CRISPR-associated protein [Enterococcus cecorum]|uniref:TM1812 family CRISPR-associated protein n=1 Tax=Enterococcus cecorum TaxID=44008 RepID=UPI00148BA847|nr:TM1812 family CRISPR-associated protein [Enterococcus cecorum]MCJ0582058.1 HEPN domain-containing protein [Enterococcus cecorum]
MKIEYMLVKGKDDYCQTVDQFNSLRSSNTRVVLKDHTFEADHRSVDYSVEMYEVESSKETLFKVTFDVKQEKEEEEQILALESADNVLRRINEKIKAFQINTIWDDVSMYYGRKLYPAIIEVEALLRQIIYLFMMKNVGSKWLKEQSPEEVKKSIKSTLEKNNQSSYPDTDALIYADFVTLGWFFFSKYSLKSDYQTLIKKFRENENMEAEKLTELLDQYESKSNWDRYFADTIAVDDLSDKWNKLYGFRNQVAHTKKITKTDYNAACAIIDELKPAFLQSLQLINTISMTVEESEAVEEVAEQTIAPKTVIVRGGREGNPLLYSNGYSQITPETLGNAFLTIGSVGEKLIDRDSAIWGISSGLVKFAEAMTLSVDPEVKAGLSV